MRKNFCIYSKFERKYTTCLKNQVFNFKKIIYLCNDKDRRGVIYYALNTKTKQGVTYYAPTL